MNRETIERVAAERCTTERMEQWKKNFGTACFADGALWRINAAWHDPREEIPSCFKLLLLQDANGEIYLGYTLPPNITRWAYVSDLIPDEGKEGGQ